MKKQGEEYSGGSVLDPKMAGFINADCGLETEN